MAKENKKQEEKEKKQDKGECIFCKIASGEVQAEKILESDNFFAINDIKPVTKGHCLIIPKKHYENILDIPSSLGSELLEFEKEVAMNKIKENKADGFNIVVNNFSAAGQLVMHAHIHLMPRYRDDGFKLCIQ